MNQIEQQDKEYLWHPFTQMKGWLEEPQTVIASAKGIMLTDTEGRSYYDAVSSLWVNIHGHGRAEIDEAIQAQLGKVAHSTALGLANIPAAQFAAELIAAAPKGLCKVFYSDDGSTAIEVAIKMAFQYWQHQGRPNKKRFISLEQAYHGDTVGTVSVGGIDLFHRVFQPLLFKPFSIPSPSCYHCKLAKSPETCQWECVKALEDLLADHHGEIAALVMEPLVQAAAGMLMARPGYLAKVRELTQRYEVLLIADEVATGFGRTGTLFACEQEGVTPDFMALSKGITGGYMPLAATVTTQAVFDAFLGDMAAKKTFYHGHSYTANQLACAAALASLRIFKKDQVIENLPPKLAAIAEELTKIAALEHVGDARQCGMIAGIELMADSATKTPYAWDQTMGAKVCMKAREHGIFIRPVGDVIVFMPPLVSTVTEIRHMLSQVAAAIDEVTNQGQFSTCGGGAHF
ncbi:MAG: adenosylmethionine--8-amino-7-oxononanoate transaminase [Sporomusaceae bacterium]|nr:adenosylmethionine--8-amino-7-oxononanoate transaminase [Sporomusaceae bacterium]